MFYHLVLQIKRFLKDKYIFGAIVAGIVLWVIAFGIAYVQIFPLEKNLILHINFQREVDAVGVAGDVIWLTVGLAVLFAIDQIISLALYFREKILSYIISYSGLFVMILGLAVIYYLTLAN
jgi:magnesium-transporting ATPase (P-type)